MYATLYLPDFYLQAALRHQSELREQPVALIATSENKLAVIQLNAAADSAGVRKGMTPSQALARCLSVVIKVRSPEQETALQEILLHYAFTLSPNVEVTAAGICTVQFTDHRDLLHKIARVIEQLAKNEMTAQAGIADSPDLGFLAAHLAQPVLQVANVRDFLDPLPIETLALGCA